MNKRNMIVAVDFDGTIVEHRYPSIGDLIPGSIDYLKKLKDAGIKLVLWTCRAEEDLNQAVEFCRSHGIEFDAVNKDISNIGLSGAISPKIYADFYIDDRAMLYPVDWDIIGAAILERSVYYGR